MYLRKSSLLGGTFQLTAQRTQLAHTLSPLKLENYGILDRDTDEKLKILVRLAQCMNNHLKKMVRRENEDVNTYLARDEYPYRTENEEWRETVKGTIQDCPGRPLSDSTRSSASPSKTSPTNASPVDIAPSDTSLSSLSETARSDTALLDPLGMELEVAHQQAVPQSYDQTVYDARLLVSVHCPSQPSQCSTLGNLCHERKTSGKVLPADLSLDTFKRAIMEPDDSNFNNPVVIRVDDFQYLLQCDTSFECVVRKLIRKSPMEIEFHVVHWGKSI
ncbi:MAG: hypothetical protein Q9221_000624 [Calogaya cf. arnoldii]